MDEMPRTFKLITVWLLIGTGVFIGVQAWQAHQQRSRFHAEGGAIELHRNLDGHFHWPGRINGIEVDFLVDTGATTTALPQELATRARLVAEHAVRSDTAGGVVTGYAARADVSLSGGVRVERMRVAVLPALSSPLLGMDMLSKMRFTQHGGVLRIELPGH